MPIVYIKAYEKKPDIIVFTNWILSIILKTLPFQKS